MIESTESRQFEHRWPVVLTIFSVVALLALLPSRIQLAPWWVPYVLGTGVLVPIVAVGLTSARRRWLRIEAMCTLFFFVIVAGGNIANLAHVIAMMMHRPTEITGLELLASSVAVWVNNVLVFSLLYWQIDRGGPEARVHHAAARIDWLFPQESTKDAPPGWQPQFIDYLYLSFSTATAFSTTDVAPLTSRAKLLMMSESTFALVTLVVVASRAINVLGD